MSHFEPNMAFDQQLRDEVERSLIRPLAGAIAEDARRLVPIDTGELKSSITSEVVSWDEALIGTDVDYAASVEFGSAPHLIRARRGGVLSNRAEGKFFGPVVHHPGTPAQPFLRPALYRERGL